MAKQLQLRRGSTTDHASFTGALGEVTVDTDKDTVVVHDNATAGGVPLATEGWLSSKPHIIPDVLYPAVANVMVDGSTALSSRTNGPNGTTLGTATKYGSVQTDGRMYYYTDIKGSKPIKDPRIGAHFGSQRCTMRSWQLLEQETAMEGKDVYSIDGREWMRINDMGQNVAYGNNPDGGDGVLWEFNGTGAYLEVTGYFNAANMLWFPYSSGDDFNWELDGVAAGSVSSGVSVSSPLGNRYVNCGSVYNLPFSSPPATPGIHTIKLVATSDNFVLQGFELIAQDTSNVNNIQIPSQNVVSYGKKFTVSGTPHYNPFAQNQAGTAVAIANTTSHGSVATGWAGTGAGYFDDTLDTATSLGLSAWVQNSKYYRPVNGGRVVRWVDSSGNIKTSVNMMPPAGTSIGASSDTNTPEANDWTTDYQPLFSSTTIDHSLAEVAKTFHWREFGNGAANGGTGATYADASMLNTNGTADDIAYVMDDGLTSLSGDDVGGNSGYGGNLQADNTNDSFYITFIGTGYTATSRKSNVESSPNTYAQNLPYGTHIVKVFRTSDTVTTTSIDGVTVDASNTYNDYASVNQITFHQPKRPPIPEDAVVIADYMLMADFVPQTAAGIEKVSKGVRMVHCSRDVFYDETDGDSFSFAMDVASSPGGFRCELGGTADSDTSATYRLPSFGTNYVQRGYQSDTRCKLFLDTTDNDSSATKDNTAGQGSYAHLTSNLTLGVYKFGANPASGQVGSFSGFDIASPIHTSSHYQTFETPFLHELVGGDRNMEQTNLVVTPDGKTWDKVTRDTSYIGKTVLQITRDGGDITSTADFIFDFLRGVANLKQCIHKENFAYSYDRVICLVDGEYSVNWDGVSRTGATGGQSILKLNGTDVRISEFGPSTGRGQGDARFTLHLKRGDYIHIVGDDLEGNQNQFLCYLVINKV